MIRASRQSLLSRVGDLFKFIVLFIDEVFALIELKAASEKRLLVVASEIETLCELLVDESTSNLAIA